MRTAITIAFLCGGKETKTLHGPEVSIQKQVEEIKKLGASKTHEEFEKVELWESGQGVSKRFKFVTQAEIDRRAEQHTKQVSPGKNPDSSDVSSGAEAEKKSEAKERKKK